ncbi:gp180 [Sphingomonas phage PAU]|uniref:gp180 n=1 Tax=Sphingomonas phage PAU TaxID=1150991 RepID=UPI0002573300|nr:gp180 [Sphingomonas phage PAU]AFF28178.1 gp180 [Sphingomonas phage PAU]
MNTTKRRLFLIKFKDSLSPECIDKDTIRYKEIYNVLRFVPTNEFEINLVNYDNPKVSEENNQQYYKYIHYEDFKNLELLETDLLIFWTGYIYVPTDVDVSKTDASNIRAFYECLESTRNKDNKRYLICTDTRCPLIKPGFYSSNEIFKEELKDINIDDIHLTYLTQAIDPEAFIEIVKSSEINSVHKNVSAIHMKLHLAPLVSHDIPKIKENHNGKFFYYAGDLRDISKHRYDNIIKFYSVDSSDLSVKPLIASNVHPDIYDKLPNVEFINKIPYSEVPVRLNEMFASVCFSEADYEKCRLLPNRIAEGIAAKTLLLIHHNIDPERKLNLEPLQYFETVEDFKKSLKYYSEKPHRRINAINNQRYQLSIEGDLDAFQFSRDFSTI